MTVDEWFTQSKILVLLEGRDGAGKDGTIKRIVQHLSPRETRVVALGAPSDRDRSAWYFQRYVPHLPAARECVLFNRSWYNRAGVERVMGFCSDAEYEEFMQTVPDFEHMLVRSGIKLLKYYLDISRGEQKTRLNARRKGSLETVEGESDRQSGAEAMGSLQPGAKRHARPHPPPGRAVDRRPRRQQASGSGQPHPGSLDASPLPPQGRGSARREFRDHFSVRPGVRGERCHCSVS